MGIPKAMKPRRNNITRNEETRTEIEDDNLNPIGEDGEYESDSEEDLLLRLMTQSDAKFDLIRGLVVMLLQINPIQTLLPDILLTQILVTIGRLKLR